MTSRLGQRSGGRCDLGDGRDDDRVDDYDFKGIYDGPEIEQKAHKYTCVARSAMCTGRNHV